MSRSLANHNHNHNHNNNNNNHNHNHGRHQQPQQPITADTPLPTIKRFAELEPVILHELKEWKRMNTACQSCPEPERQFSPTHLLGMAVGTHSVGR